MPNFPGFGALNLVNSPKYRSEVRGGALVYLQGTASTGVFLIGVGGTMWRRGATRLETLAISVLKQPASLPDRSGSQRCHRALASSSSSIYSSAAPFYKTGPLFAGHQPGDGEKSLKKEKSVEDVMPIATGHEREEIEFALEGKKRFDLDPPRGPFGTKEVPAIIESYFDKRIVGCPGGAGDDEHDVIWFWLEKDKPFECPVCSQYFQGPKMGVTHCYGEFSSWICTCVSALAEACVQNKFATLAKSFFCVKVASII